MILYLMRHGIAEDRGPSGADFDRRLTEAGRVFVHTAAVALLGARSAAPLPRLLASPLVRAEQTARIVLHVACAPGARVEVRDELASGSLPLGLVEDLTASGQDALLVGHQPTLEQLARHLVAPKATASTGRDGPSLPRGFSTCVIMALAREASEPRWTLVSVLDPRDLAPPLDAR